MITSLAILALTFIQEKPAPVDWQTPRFQAVLRDLSEFARQVDAGTRTLANAYFKEGQPSGMLTEIRALAIEYPSLVPLLAKYLRARDEPLMGRALAVIAVGQPGTTEIAKVLGELLADPPDLKLTMAVFSESQDAFDRLGRHQDWSTPLAIIQSLDPSPSWKPYSSSSDGWSTRRAPWRSVLYAPKGVDIRPILDGLLALLNRKEIGKKMKWMGLDLAWSITRCGSFTPEQRRKLRDLMVPAYLEKDDCWYLAMEFLMGNHTLGPPDVETLGKGLANLNLKERFLVIEEIARTPDSLFEPAFRKHLEETIKLLSQPPKESGVQMGVLRNFLRAFKMRWSDDPLVKPFLDNASETLKKRLAEVP